jgi:hypothetical protein
MTYQLLKFEIQILLTVILEQGQLLNNTKQLQSVNMNAPSAITSTAQSANVSNSNNSSLSYDNMTNYLNSSILLNHSSSINDTSLQSYNTSQQSYPSSNFHHSGLLQNNSNQYLHNEIQRLNQIICKIEPFMVIYGQRISLLENILKEQIDDPKPKAQMITLPIEDFLVNRMRLDSDYLVSLIQRNNFFRTVINIIRKANANDINHLPETDEISNLTMFSNSINLKNKKFTKGETASQVYLHHLSIKMKFWHILRKTWENSGLFNQKNPRKMAAEYENYSHNKCITAMSVMISKVCFNSLECLWQTKLLSSKGNVLNFL